MSARVRERERKLGINGLLQLLLKHIKIALNMQQQHKALPR